MCCRAGPQFVAYQFWFAGVGKKMVPRCDACWNACWLGLVIGDFVWFCGFVVEWLGGWSFAGLLVIDVDRFLWFVYYFGLFSVVT